MMGNIYTDPSDYRIAPDEAVAAQDYHKLFKNGVRVVSVIWNVYNVPLNLRLAGFTTEGLAVEFVQRRCNPAIESARVYSDICRCGRCGPAWDYIKVGGLTFERCVSCKNPMRHDVMLALNKPFTEDFDLDAFLEM